MPLKILEPAERALDWDEEESGERVGEARVREHHVRPLTLLSPQKGKEAWPHHLIPGLSLPEQTKEHPYPAAMRHRLQRLLRILSSKSSSSWFIVSRLISASCDADVPTCRIALRPLL